MAVNSIWHSFLCNNESIISNFRGAKFIIFMSISVPSSYSYLPESSVLRAAVDFLLEAGKLG